MKRTKAPAVLSTEPVRVIEASEVHTVTTEFDYGPIESPMHPDDCFDGAEGEDLNTEEFFDGVLSTLRDTAKAFSELHGSAVFRPFSPEECDTVLASFWRVSSEITSLRSLSDEEQYHLWTHHILYCLDHTRRAQKIVDQKAPMSTASVKLRNLVDDLTATIA